MTRASRNWCKRQNKRNYLGNRKIKQWEKSCHLGIKWKQRRTPISVYHSSCYETAAIKADTQRSGHFSGFSRNISRHLGSNGLHGFSVYNRFVEFQPLYTLICPHPDPQLRRLDSESKRDTLLCEQQWRPFSLMWGAHGKSTRGLLPFTELAWQWNQNQDHFTLYLLKKVWYFYWVFKSGSQVLIWCHS